MKQRDKKSWRINLKRWEGTLLKREAKLFNSFAEERMMAIREEMPVLACYRKHVHAAIFNVIVDAYKYGRKIEKGVKKIKRRKK